VTPVAILGAGSWGTALAVHVARRGGDVRLWARDPALAEALSRTRRNPRYLSDVSLPDSICATSELDAAVSGADFVVVAVPTYAVRSVMRAATPRLTARAILVSAAKGLESESLQRMSQVVAAESGERHAVVVLSGPA
jgi:glycerol-3-phosphate dehydrogenase (NAD(P)+)